MRIGSVILVVWLVIGALAAYQRDAGLPATGVVSAELVQRLSTAAG